MTITEISIISEKVSDTHSTFISNINELNKILEPINLKVSELICYNGYNDIGNKGIIESTWKIAPIEKNKKRDF
jgi:hypothetical protein